MRPGEAQEARRLIRWPMWHGLIPFALMGALWALVANVEVATRVATETLATECAGLVRRPGAQLERLAHYADPTSSEADTVSIIQCDYLPQRKPEPIPFELAARIARAAAAEAERIEQQTVAQWPWLIVPRPA